jgi:hypothetical protein
MVMVKDEDRVFKLGVLPDVKYPKIKVRSLK